MSAQTFDNFVSGSYSAIARNLAADTCLNLYVESAETGTGKNHAGLFGTPGTSLFTTLPTSPVRGILIGEDLLFVVSGAVYYQVLQNGTYVARGNVGNDGNPVQMFENGGQVMIVSDGQAWIDGGGPAGSSSIPVDWADIAGACNTSGTAVTWVSGFKFPSDAAGQLMTINGINYTVSTVNSLTSITLTATAGTQTNVLWYGPGGAVPAQFQNGSGTVTTVGTAVTWVSGDQFDSSNVGNVFYVNGQRFLVSSVTSATVLVLSTSAGTQGSTWTGVVNTLGTAVTWVSGNTFAGLIAGQTITIVSVPYIIASITDSTDLVLTATAPTASAASYSAVEGVSYTSAYPVTASCGGYMDQYFIVAQPGTRNFNISGIGDGKLWNPLDVGVKEAYGDGIAQILCDHEQLWLMGDKTIEVWQDTGAAAFPFQRIPGAFVQMGIAAPFTVCKIATSGVVAWVGGDARGRMVAYAANGFIPVRISTHAVETAWLAMVQANNSGGAEGATAFSYSDQGHDFWVINFPAGNQTWVYDFTEKLWHRRGIWTGVPVDYADTYGTVNTSGTAVTWETGYQFSSDAAGQAITINAVAYTISTVNSPTSITLTATAGTQTGVAYSAPVGVNQVLGQTCGWIFDEWIVGDYSTGNLYYMSTGIYLDVGTSILRARAAPHVAGPLLQLANPSATSTGSAFNSNWTFYHRFILDLLFGQGANANLLLDWSNDGGNTFGVIHTAGSGTPTGLAGNYNPRVIWRRLGKSQDRVFRVRYLGGGQVAWINAYLESTAGSS